MPCTESLCARAGKNAALCIDIGKERFQTAFAESLVRETDDEKQVHA